MPKTIAVHAVTPPIVALVCAAAAGAWLGFGSCGGYVWYDYVGYGVLVLAVSAVTTLSPGSIAWRAGLAVLVIAAFLVARGAGFAAYVGAGSSGEYLQQIGSSFSSGLC